MVCAAEDCTAPGKNIGVRLDARQEDGSFPPDACAWYCSTECMKKQGATHERAVDRALYGTVQCTEEGCDEKFHDLGSMRKHVSRAHRTPKVQAGMSDLEILGAHAVQIAANANGAVTKMVGVTVDKLSKAAVNIKKMELKHKDRSRQGAGLPGRSRLDNRGTAEETEVQRASDAQAQASAGVFAPGVGAAEWQQMFDPISGKPYYANHKRKTTQWHLPTPTYNHGTAEETKVQSVEVAEVHSSVQARSPPVLILILILPPP